MTRLSLSPSLMRGSLEDPSDSAFPGRGSRRPGQVLIL
jgi:hypothetical protein